MPCTQVASCRHRTPICAVNRCLQPSSDAADEFVSSYSCTQYMPTTTLADAQVHISGINSNHSVGCLLGRSMVWNDQRVSHSITHRLCQVPFFKTRLFT